MLKHQETASRARIFVTALLCMLPSLSFGSMLAYVSVSLPYYTTINNGSNIYMDDEQSSWFVSLNQPIRMLGTLLATYLNEKIGRKKTLILAAVTMVAGGCINYFAASFMMLMIGQNISSFGSGIGITPSYSLLSDVSIIKLRGTLGSMNTLTTNAGYLYGLALGFFVPVSYLPIFVASPSMLFMVLTWLLTESPIWLAKEGKTEEAENVLQKLRGKRYDVTPEIKEILEVVSQDQNNNNKSSGFSKEVLKPAVLITLLFFFQSMSGADNLCYFALIIFKDQYIDEKVVALFFQLTITFGYLVSPIIMARINRRPQFITASIVHCFGMILLGASIANFIPDFSLKQYIPLFCVSVLGLCYGLGVGPVPFVLMSEFFGVKHKSFGMALGMVSRCSVSFLQLKVFVYVKSWIGMDGICFVHAIMNILGALFVFLVLPETRNKSLSELEDIWKSGSDLVQQKLQQDNTYNRKCEIDDFDFDDDEKEKGFVKA